MLTRLRTELDLPDLVSSEGRLEARLQLAHLKHGALIPPPGARHALIEIGCSDFNTMDEQAHTCVAPCCRVGRSEHVAVLQRGRVAGNGRVAVLQRSPLWAPGPACGDC